MKTRKTTAIIFLLAFIVVVTPLTFSVSQSVPQLINYQGRLTSTGGEPLDGVSVDLQFIFYESATGSTAYLTVTQQNVQVSGGIYNVLIGSGTVTPGIETTLDRVFQNHSTVWMGIQVGTDPEMQPRTLISSVPYAMAIDKMLVVRIIQEYNSSSDFDGDGHDKESMGGDDCNDADNQIAPGLPELCNGIDDDCDGTIDDGTTCDDGNVCTIDICQPGGGCQHINNDIPCEDGDLCTLSDVCSGGTCVSGSPKNCSDLNVCTDDACIPATGLCDYTFNSDPCDDENYCTDNDVCIDGFCEGGSLVDCDDDNVCTDDACVSAYGCEYYYNFGPCDDLDPCSTQDVCEFDYCMPGPIDKDTDADTQIDANCGGPDCDDDNMDVHAGAPELCDGIDNQCPGDPGYGEVDEGCP